MVIYLIPSVVLLEQFLASGESRVNIHRKNCGVILAIDWLNAQILVCF